MVFCGFDRMCSVVCLMPNMLNLEQNLFFESVLGVVVGSCNVFAIIRRFDNGLVVLMLNIYQLKADRLPWVLCWKSWNCYCQFICSMFS